MRVALLARYPHIDTVPWKRALLAGLLETGADLLLVYTDSALRDELRAGLGTFGGTGALRRYRANRESTEAHAEPRETLAAWAKRHGVEATRHRRIGDPELSAALRAFKPQILILAGAPIVPASVLAIPSILSINPHYALLPRYRGMSVTEWSIYHGDPVAVTVHAVDAGIDTGDILAYDYVRVLPGDTLASLRIKQQNLAQQLLLEVSNALLHGGCARLPQRKEEGKQFYRMHPALRQRVELTLSTGSYAWLDRVPDEPPLLPALSVSAK
jgi:folate-dependent phosphoribosylglycinamide formyltransferase PurN